MMGQMLLLGTLLASISAVSMELLTAVDCDQSYECVRHPLNCTSSADCLYLVKHQRNGTYLNIKVSVRTPQKWIGVGFNDVLEKPMVGTRGVLCMDLTGGDAPQTVAFHAEEYAAPQTSAMIQAGAITNNVRKYGGAIICDVSVPFAGNSYFRALNFHDGHLIVIAWGPSDEYAIAYHGDGNYIYQQVLFPRISVRPADLNAAECGTTYGCTRSPAGCMSSASCSHLVMYKKDGANVNIKMSVRDADWVGVGFNKDVTSPMIGSRGVICKHVGSSVKIEVFNATTHALPDIIAMNTTGATSSYLRMHNGSTICEFTIPFAGNDAFHSLNTNEKRLLIMAWGGLDSGQETIMYHGQNNKVVHEVNVTKTIVNEPTVPTTAPPNMPQELSGARCGIDFSCIRKPKDCKTDCSLLITYKRNNSVVQIQMMTKTHQWIALGFNNKKDADQMIGTNGIVCKIHHSDVKLEAFSADAKALPRMTPAMMSNVATSSLRTIPGGHVCELSFLFDINSLSSPMVISAYGKLKEGGTDIGYHGKRNYVFFADDLKSPKITDLKASAGNRKMPQAFFMLMSIAVMLFN